jgi:hypothetical protein
MGYACYTTPRGDAGYGVDDVCHAEGCDEKIDRGLSHLCGDTPGADDDIGCGWWFCVEHLFLPPPGFAVDGDTSLCSECWDLIAERVGLLKIKRG